MTIAGHVPPRPAAPSLLTRTRALLVPLIFGLPPVVGTVMVSARVLPFPGSSVTRIIAFSTAVVLGAYLIARRGRPAVTASNIVALPLFLMGLYPAAFTFAENLTGVSASWFSPPYLILCLATAAVAARAPREAARTLHEVLSIVAVILLATAVWVIGGTYWWPPDYAPRTAQAIGRISKPLLTPSSVDQRPDVYHLLLDGMGRPDILHDRYAMDVDEQVSELTSLGFEVSLNESHANYVQTHLSLSSMLNLVYLDELLDAQATSQDRRPLHDLISRARVPAVFKQLGYEVEYVGSGFLTNGAFETADQCDCPQLWYADAEVGAISLTPLEALLNLGFGSRSHYRRSMHVFDAFERSRVDSRPRFVFAHTAVPHPAFVVDEQGRFSSPGGPPNGGDASFFVGTPDQYRRGYRAQATFALRRAVLSARRLVEASQRDHRDAIVIISGDHGPRLGLDARNPTAESGLYTLPVLLAIHWPEHLRPVQSPVSLVNLYRTLFRRVFGMDLPPLPDNGYVSAFTAPYAVTRVEGLHQAP